MYDISVSIPTRTMGNISTAKMACYTLKQVHQIEIKSYIQNVYHRKI